MLLTSECACPGTWAGMQALMNACMARYGMHYNLLKV